MNKDNFVAMVYHLCPICAKRDDGEILLHTKFGDLSKIDKQNVGFSNPCDECQAAIDSGAIMIIVIDQSKSGDMAFENLYRTGEVFGVTEDAILRVFNPSAVREKIIKSRYCIMDYLTARKCGLPTKYLQPIE